MKASMLGNLGPSLPSLHRPASPHLPPDSGDLYFAINQNSQAIKIFRDSLSIYKQLKALKDDSGLGGGGGDKRAMLSIQSSLALALCTGPNSDEGMALFKTTLAEEAAHVGPHHHNLLTKYYNAGICASMKGLIVDAIELMNRCIETCERNPHLPSDSTCERAQGSLDDLRRRRRLAPTDL
jgi:hypothetical protein